MPPTSCSALQAALECNSPVFHWFFCALDKPNKRTEKSACHFGQMPFFALHLCHDTRKNHPPLKKYLDNNWTIGYIANYMAKRLSLGELEILSEFFASWAQRIDLGRDLVEAGTLSARKRWCALWQALHGPLIQKEIAILTATGVSADQLMTWRAEKNFRALADTAAEEFANHVGGEVTAAVFGDKIRRLVLTSLWVRLPGFNVADNPLIEAINISAKELERNPIKRNIMRLYNLLVALRDTLRLAQEQLKPTKWQEIENKAHNVIAPILATFETRVKEAKAKGLLDSELSAVLLNVVISLEFLLNYSKVVV
ncbi:MAG: hypothetical protein ABIK18_04355 [candidate division WOR-3 bacterium]